ncbi:MAG: HNH endonuclease [Gammaproteobacteria bacterium]|jgi:5-methylcytosine-specific restriction endonuclease McrA|nr:HNH endonuclease [Gammaproteobacteria bacterium]|tara:strand:+ start:257 stop:838 length:582 start_codon:yes stop_codon:yes gene_type:complete
MLNNLNQQILRTDVSGMPLEWVSYQDAVRLYFNDQIAYTCGSNIMTICGGINAVTHRRSKVDVNSIIATYGNNKNLANRYSPPLNNTTLFKRDDHLCLYCGNKFHSENLSRDHVTPLFQGGKDLWVNVVSACKRCNNAKAGRTPEEANMELLAIPFAPTHAEYIFLQGKIILFDQMEFLKQHFPRTSPLRNRL